MILAGINGSPNRNGNTKALLEEILARARELGAETFIIEAGEVVETAKWPFCTACSSPCSGACFKGTKLEEAYDLLRKADGIILGSPVYFGSVSSQLKAFFDKSRKLRGEKAFYNKVASGVTVGAAKYGGQETAIKALHDIMLIHGMIIVGDGFIDDDCGHHGVCAQKPSESDGFALKRAGIMAKRMVEVCEATKELRQKGSNTGN